MLNTNEKKANAYSIQWYWLIPSLLTLHYKTPEKVIEWVMVMIYRYRVRRHLRCYVFCDFFPMIVTNGMCSLVLVSLFV